MAPLEASLLGVAIALTVALLVGLRLRYTSLLAEFERDAGWHRMWTERIMNTTDERDEPDRP